MNASHIKLMIQIIGSILIVSFWWLTMAFLYYLVWILSKFIESLVSSYSHLQITIGFFLFFILLWFIWFFLKEMEITKQKRIESDEEELEFYKIKNSIQKEKELNLLKSSKYLYL